MRKYLPTLAELVDRLSIIQLKEVFIPEHKEEYAKEINDIISENKVKGVIIGNPINMDGTKGKSSQRALDFSSNLSKNITVPVTMWDERLSSEGTFKITSELGINTSRKVKNLDKNAAAFILQGAIDLLSN